MQNMIIERLTSCGFKVTNSGIIYKQSATNKSKEKAGQLNDRSVYFYAQNVAPFKHGTNTFRDILGSNFTLGGVGSELHVVKTTTTQIQHNFTFEDYIKTTKKKNQFGIYLNSQAENLTSLYDIRGVKNGYLEDATLLPYIDYNNNFITAKIVKYNTKTGKRNKAQYSNSWFHAYKPIKKELGITDKIQKEINCFFGENLVANNNKPVVIVEAEKTAIILSMLFENIVFIASGGLGKLKTLDYKFLLNRDVSLYPDNGASEWHEIGKKRNWFVSEILEAKGTKGSDAADYLEHDLWLEIEAELNKIANRSIEASNELNFSYKEKQTDRFCSTITKELGLIYYTEQTDKERDKQGYYIGKHFKISNYGEFYCITANVDVNRYEFIDNKKVKPTAEILLKRLEQTFRVLKKLNPEENISYHFDKILNHVLENSNYLFNKYYILNELMPMWANDANVLNAYIKKRDWVKLNTTIKDDAEFTRLLNDDRKAAATNIILKELEPLINKGEYIEPKLLGLFKAQFNPFVFNLIKDYNKNVIGCNTVNNYNEKIKVCQYLQHVEAYTNHYENPKKVQKYHTTYNNTYIACAQNVPTFKKPNQNIVETNTMVAKRIVKEYFNFKPKRNALKNIRTIIEYYLSNPNDISIERIKIDKTTRLVTKNNISMAQMRETLEQQKVTQGLTAKEAFDYPLDLSDSILNIPQEAAMQENAQFLYSWILFNYPEVSEVEKIEIYKNPINYLLQVNTVIAA
jgi:hypothetical protein